jgi:hypothetical protein
MDRRTFLHNDIATSGTLAPAALSQSTGKKPGVEKNLLNACYFRAQMSTRVPRRVSEGMKRMGGAGTNTVSTAVPEQDLHAAVKNIRTVCEKAAKAARAVHAVPSRWGGLVAGAPKVPNLFSVTDPQTWMLKEDGERRTAHLLPAQHLEPRPQHSCPCPAPAEVREFAPPQPGPATNPDEQSKALGMNPFTSISFA